MPRGSVHGFEYAQLPVFKYQTFDREDLTFSTLPADLRGREPIRFFGQDADFDVPKLDDSSKGPDPDVVDVVPSDQEAETQVLPEKTDAAIDEPMIGKAPDPAEGMYHLP